MGCGCKSGSSVKRSVIKRTINKTSGNKNTSSSSGKIIRRIIK